MNEVGFGPDAGVIVTLLALKQFDGEPPVRPVIFAWNEVWLYCASGGLVPTLAVTTPEETLNVEMAIWGNFPRFGRVPVHGPSVPPKFSCRSAIVTPPLLPWVWVTAPKSRPPLVNEPPSPGLLLAPSPNEELVSVVP